MIDPKKIDEVRDKGFTYIPSVLTPNQVMQLRTALEAAITEDLNKWKDSPYYSIDRYMVHNLFMRGQPFIDLLEQPVMHAYLSQLLSDTCIVYAYQSSSLPAQGTNYSNRIHIDCPRVIPNYLTNMGVIFPLNDFTPENGATYFLPYSHERLSAPSEEEFMSNAERLYCKAGDMILVNPRTWHRGGINTTQETRHAATLNVCRSYMRQRFDFPRMIPQDMQKNLGETAKRFLGYNVRVPTSLEEYYVAPEERLYKPNQG